ncbi:FAD-dependent oxidoreductase, partial [Bacteroidia bacterium]|nr:FAD-dependent oxidoreductase [Bacteroidia bacterium]
CGGSSVPRDLGLKGRKFKGIYFAMEYLEQSNRRVAGKEVANSIEVEGEDVLVIGGGDTGSDCIGTSNRQKAKSVTQLEILGKPPEIRDAQNPWPNWPLILRSSSSHEEGCKREYSVLTKEFISQDGMSLSGLRVVDIEWSKSTSGKHSFEEIVGTERLIRCTKIFLAMGFLHPEKEGLLSKLKVELDSRGNVLTNNYETSIRKVFAAGDIKRGQSLVVWAISEGREAARKIDEFLMGNSSKLEAKEKGVFQLSS